MTPASTARRASSGRVMPLTMNGPAHCSRSQAMSSQRASGACIHWKYAAKKPGTSSPGRATFGTPRSGIFPVRR